MRTRQIVRWSLVSLVALGILLLFVLPGRTLLAQRSALGRTMHQSETLAQENAKLSERVRQLQDPAEIEQIARSEYGLVMPGQQAYAILPSRQGANSFWARTGF